MEQDFPLVRAQLRCPLCQGEKQSGALVCWPCYHRYEMRYGDDFAISIVASKENCLAQQITPVSREDSLHLVQ